MTPITRPPFLRHPVLFPSLIALATFLAYLPALRADLVWDDILYITMNRTIKQSNGLWKIWTDPSASASPYPLVFTTYWFEYLLWGARPAGYHAVNVALHIWDTLLLWGVLKRLEISGAWIATAIFALHPLHVESVVLVEERKDVLSVFFYLLSVLAWLRFERTGGKFVYVASIVAFVCAMFSKTVVCTLPLALLLLSWWKDPIGWKRRIPWIVPMLAVSAALGIVTIHWEKTRTGAAADVIDLSFLDRCFIAGRSTWFYVGKLLWPVNLMTIYPKWKLEDGTWEQSVYFIGAALLLTRIWKARRWIPRGMFVGIGYYLVTLAPAMGWINYSTMFYSYVADHYQYLAGIGLIALFAASLKQMASFFAFRLSPFAFPFSSFIPHPSSFCASVVMLALMGILTWRQSATYRTGEIFWRHNLQKNPGSTFTHYDLGVEFRKQNRIDEAIEEYKRAIALDARNIPAYINLGSAYVLQGETEMAMRSFQWAIKVKPRTHKDARQRALAYGDIGNLLAEQGRNDEAMEKYEIGLKIDAKSDFVLQNQAKLFAKLGKTEEAMKAFSRAIVSNPDSQQAHWGLADLFFGQQRFHEAEKHYREVTRIVPDEAVPHNSLGSALAMRGKVSGALREFQRALKLKPDYPEAEKNLALAQGKAALQKGK